MNHNKSTDTLLFLLSFTKTQREKFFERTFFVSPGAQKGWETAGFEDTLPQYLPISTLPQSKKEISGKIYIYVKDICFTFNWQKI